MSAVLQGDVSESDEEKTILPQQKTKSTLLQRAKRAVRLSAKTEDNVVARPILISPIIVGSILLLEIVTLCGWLVIFALRLKHAKEISAGIYEENDTVEILHEKIHADLLTLDVITIAPHFGVLLSVLALRTELSNKCNKAVCSGAEANIAWIAPIIVCVFFDVCTLARVNVFYPNENDVVAFASLTCASSLIAALWTWAVYRELKNPNKENE